MCIRYVFTHSCHHAGHGPILRCPYASSSIIPPQHKLTETSLNLPISCPFCNNTSLSCAPGAGVLTIMNTSLALRWEILRTCFIEELKSDDWKVGYNYMNGNWIPMAWIPRPRGIVTELHVAELQMLGLGGPWEWEGTEKIIRVESRWSHRGRRSVRSRLPAMLSELRGRIGKEG